MFLRCSLSYHLKFISKILLEMGKLSNQAGHKVLSCEIPIHVIRMLTDSFVLYENSQLKLYET